MPAKKAHSSHILAALTSYAGEIWHLNFSFLAVGTPGCVSYAEKLSQQHWSRIIKLKLKYYQYGKKHTKKNSLRIFMILLPEIISILKTKKSKERSSAFSNLTSNMRTGKGEELGLTIEY